MPSPSQSLPHHQLSSHQLSTGAKKSPSHQIRLPQASRQLRSSAIAGPEKAANAVTTMANAARTYAKALQRALGGVQSPKTGPSIGGSKRALRRGMWGLCYR